MKKNIEPILEEVLKRVDAKEDLEKIKKPLKKFLEKIEKKIKERKINTEIFVGGSFAKNTIIKKDHYDIDIFIRFSKSKEDLSEITKKILEGEKFSVIHGSRDYFRIQKDNFFLEIIPVLKIKKIEEFENITDLSYSHVNYIKKKIKSKKIIDEIKIAKAFCYANHCYGAESYIKGFSGYSLELLIYHYGSFLKFIKAIDKSKKGEKIIIDIEKHFKNKNQILMDLNSSKIESPIILIDPTHKNRNALAALSNGTFERFKKAVREFLKKPSIKSFEEKKTDLEKIKKDAGKKSLEFVLLEAVTNKQEGDIAGSKLLKFYNHLCKEIGKYFYIKNKGFNYNNKQSARYFFVVKEKEEIIIEGPSTEDGKNLKAFEKVHKNYSIKHSRVYAKEKIIFSLKEFFKRWIKKNKKKIEEMSIKSFDILD